MELIEQLIRIALPLLLAVLGGVICERSGVVNIALEGKLLVGAFVASVVATAVGSAMLGLVAGVLGGVLWGSLYGYLIVYVRSEPVVTGFGFNLLAVALTSALLLVIYGKGQNADEAPGVSGVWTSWLVWVLLVLGAVAIAWYFRSRTALRIRACGDSPLAVSVAGLNVQRYRFIATLICGGLCGAGGAYLALSQFGFVRDMSAGRGYIALAIVVTSGWRPLWGGLLCLGLGGLQALAIRHREFLHPDLVDASPYIVALAVLAIVGTRGRVPTSLQ